MSNTMRNATIGVVLALIAVFLVASGYLARVVLEPEADVPAAAAGNGDADDDSSRLSFELLDEITDVIESDFVDADDLSPEQLREGAIHGLLETLNDPHTVYIDPQTYALSQNDFEGSFQGIGATVSQQGNYVVIVRPIPNTPAERAGLQAGDLILAVDGEDAEDWSVQQAVTRIRGERGTTVDLTVRHSDGTEETLTIERDEIPVESVSLLPPGGVLRDEDGNEVTEFAYIHINQFSRTTPDELQTVLEQAVADGKQGLIIDVRQNPGGLLQETIEISDMFLDSGEIFSQVDRDGSTQTASASPGVVTDLPVVIIQDEFSASGAELFAAALQENGRAVVVGSRSFGKGTVNHAVPLSDGGALYVSIARWLTPERNQIEGNGVTPDVPITLTLEDIEGGRDIAVYRAIDVLRNGGEIPDDLPTPTPTETPAEATAATATATP